MDYVSAGLKQYVPKARGVLGLRARLAKLADSGASNPLTCVIPAPILTRSKLPVHLDYVLPQHVKPLLSIIAFLRILRLCRVEEALIRKSQLTQKRGSYAMLLPCTEGQKKHTHAWTYHDLRKLNDRRIYEEKAPNCVHKKPGILHCSHRVQRSWDSVLAEFVEKHPDKYDYDATTYKGMTYPITVTCRTCCTTFTPTPNRHISGNQGKGTGCPVCAQKIRSYSQITAKGMRIKATGKNGLIQGYEHIALELLLNVGRIEPENFRFAYDTETPVIGYFNVVDKGRRRYFPDFYDVGSETVYEVKSTWTMFHTKAAFYTTQSKYKAVVKQGFSMVLILVYEYKHYMYRRIPLPANWHTMSWKDAKTWLASTLSLPETKKPKNYADSRELKHVRLIDKSLIPLDNSRQISHPIYSDRNTQ